MHSARVVVLIVAVAFACVSCQATNSNHPRHTLLNLVRAASGLAQSYSQDQTLQKQNNPLLYPRSQDFDVSLSEKEDLHADLPESRLTQIPSSEDSQSTEEDEYSRRPSWSKRSEESLPESGQQEVLGNIKQVGSSLSQNFLRNARATTRPYDVPQIECPPADDQMERFPCPSPDRMGRYRCIDDHVLCDGFIDCPDGEDEDRQQCMFYKTTKAHLDVIADAIIRFIRGRK